MPRWAFMNQGTFRAVVSLRNCLCALGTFGMAASP